MGYTHYFTFNKKEAASKLEAKYQNAIKKIDRIVKFAYNKEGISLSGYSAHAKNYGGINFNGKQDDGLETFYLREHFSQNEAFNFCKTGERPYDVVVVAALITLKHVLGENVMVESDGSTKDWESGLELAKKALKLKSLTIPKTIGE